MENNPEQVRGNLRNRLLICVLPTAVAVIAGFTALLAGPGSRFGLWHYRAGFEMLRWALYGGLAALLLSILLLFFIRREKKCLLAALPGALTGVVIIVVVVNLWLDTRNAPPIHDISTDIVNPPQFVDILPLRKDATNPAEYGGPEVAIRQLQAYPDVKPLVLSVPADRVFDAALDTVRKMGWKIIFSAKPEGRIEATDTTLWFGFTDDIVIRITAADHRSIVDIRSVSRTGRGDAGKNAQRVKEFLEELRRIT